MSGDLKRGLGHRLPSLWWSFRAQGRLVVPVSEVPGCVVVRLPIDLNLFVAEFCSAEIICIEFSCGIIAPVSPNFLAQNCRVVSHRLLLEDVLTSGGRLSPAFIISKTCL